MREITIVQSSGLSAHKIRAFLVAGMVAVFLVYMFYTATFRGRRVDTSDSSSDVVLTAGASEDVETAASPAFLGVQIVSIDDVLAENLQLGTRAGVLINNIIPGSPAEAAGLQRGDVILAYDNSIVTDTAGFGELIAGSEAGDTVRIVYARDGQKRFAYAELAQASPIVKTAGGADESPGGWGASLSPLTPALRNDFGIPNDVDGIILLSVASGGAADQAGLKPGDVITGLENTPIDDMSDFFDVMSEDKDQISLLDVFSDGRMEYVVIESATVMEEVKEAADDTAGGLVQRFVSFFEGIHNSYFVDDEAAVEEEIEELEQASILAAGKFAAVSGWIPWIGLAGVAFAGWLYMSVSLCPAGTEKMQNIAEKIHSGAVFYLRKEYRIVFICACVTFLIISLFLGITMGISFAAGVACSLLAGYIGIEAATCSSVRTCQAAKDGGIRRALRIAFRGGAVMGMAVASLVILGISVVCVSVSWDNADMPLLTIGFALGASFAALFARVGGGIFTKSADVGADLVGKLEAGMQEDDPRNPAVIADNVGDCVGDTAGMGADLFESCAGSVIATIAIGATMTDCVVCMYLPLLLLCVGLISSAIAILAMGYIRIAGPQSTLRYTTYIAGGLFLAGAYCLVSMLSSDFTLLWVIVTGMLCGVLMGIECEYFASGPPVKSIARSAEWGTANTLITGFAVGLRSAILPVITICATIFISYKLMGSYGVALSAVGMLSTTGIIMALDAYGPITDNAGGIAQMSGMESGVRDITDELDALGNTTAAIGKGFAVGSAAMTAVAFFSAYVKAVGLDALELTTNTMTGLMLGAVVPFAVAALTMKSVGKVADKMVVEIRRQFDSIKGLLEGKTDPDVDRCIDIAAEGALEELILPGVIAVSAPLAIGFTMGKEALGGFLIGATVTGIILGMVMTNAGAAWDNAKKWIEKGHFGGKGSRAHEASIVGDTLGDPFKDTAGPAMNVLVKLMAVVSLAFAPLIRLF